MDENFEMCVKLLESPVVQIIEKASQNLIGFIQISTMTKDSEAKVSFLPRHLPSMIKALDKDKKTINKRVLKCIFWGLNQPNSSLKLSETVKFSSGSFNVKDMLKKVCDKNVNSSDTGLQTTASELKKLLD